LLLDHGAKPRCELRRPMRSNFSARLEAEAMAGFSCVKHKNI
jgi:hypothetical protein